MIDLSRNRKAEDERWEPEEIAMAVLAALIWLPMAFLLGGAL